MSIGQLFDRTFRLYRQNFVRFVTLIAVVQVPIGLLTILPIWGMQSLATGLQSPDPKALPVLIITAVIAYFALLAVFLVGAILQSGAMTRAAAEAYQGRTLSVGEAYSSVLSRVGGLLGLGILVSLGVFAGLLLCVVPGIILSLMWALATPALIVEGVGPTEAMGRSKQLASRNLGKVFLVGLVAGLIGLVASLPFSGLSAVASELLKASGQPTIVGIVVSQLIALPGAVLVGPIQYLAIALLYFDLRIRKEGFDLEMLARTAGPRGY
jgi:hypothetical protein